MAENKVPVDVSRFRAIKERSSPPLSTTLPTGVPATADISRFIEDPNNPRTEFEGPDFQHFVEDIREHGVLQPVVVVPSGDKLMIRWGARRLRAARVLGLPTLPYLLQTDERQQSDFAQVSENEQRAALSAMDLARFVERKVTEGMQKQDIAAKLRKTGPTVTYLLSLASAPGFILQMYQSGKCTHAENLYHLRQLWEKNTAEVEARCASQETITASFIKSLKTQVDSSNQSKPEKSKRTKSARSLVALPKTSRSFEKKLLAYKGNAVRIVRGLMVVTDSQGVEHEIGGDALAELILGSGAGGDQK